MLANNMPDRTENIRLETYLIRDGFDVPATGRGAFPFGTVLKYRLVLPRLLGVTTPVLRIWKDGSASNDLPFTFIDVHHDTGTEEYELVLNPIDWLSDEKYGLFYYRILLVRASDTLFSDSINNVDMSFGKQEGYPFRLLIHERDVNESFLPGLMYHIFVDRFFRGDGAVQYPDGERGNLLNPDWDNGIPQYAEKNGAPLSNNVVFGGNLWGIIQKLEYLKQLGVRTLYLSPIFKAYSNHKYDTGDYETVDPGFGGDAAFDCLIQAAHQAGIHVVLDGVFNHTGDDSRYFNRYGSYDCIGAYQSPDSTYRDWYTFSKYPDNYTSWWGIPILPRLNHDNPDVREYFTGDEGICAKWIEKGIDGWRLDVADELNNEFLDEFHNTAKRTGIRKNGEYPYIVGEVWENAADKISYGQRRHYLAGGQLDSVMNYPLRNAILAFIQYGDAEFLYNTLTEIYSCYPTFAADRLMNILGTHDTERILTVLGSNPEDFDEDNKHLSVKRLTREQRDTAALYLKMASVLQYTVYGFPSVYYGDEVGLEGYHDPFCRMPFPWKDLTDSTKLSDFRRDLLNHYRKLGELRKDPCFEGGEGSFEIVSHGEEYIAYKRVSRDGSRQCLTVLNRGTQPVVLTLGDTVNQQPLISCGKNNVSKNRLTVFPDSGCVILLTAPVSVKESH